MGKEVRFDASDGFFYVGGEQLYWSSVYLLDRSAVHGYSLDQACQDLKIDPLKCSVLKEEIDQLLSMGLIRSSKGQLFQTEKGKYILDLVKLEQKGVDLREKAQADLEEVERDIQKVDSVSGGGVVLEEACDEPSLNKLPVRIVISAFSGLLFIPFSFIFLLCSPRGRL